MATQEAAPVSAPSRPPAENMVWIPGGTFLMGSDRHYAEEAPAHKVKVAGFWIGACAVTNAEFARFVDATGYVLNAPLTPRIIRGHSRNCSSRRRWCSKRRAALST